MIKPTVGRVVWYTRQKSPHEQEALAKLAAIVCAVHNDRLVSLAIFSEQGHVLAAQGIVLVQEGDEKPDAGNYAEWMPYQKGQAAKTEALEAAAATS